MKRRAGFTLVELLVVVSILLILTTITVATFNSFQNAERIRSSARQVQSSLMGARDRAIRLQKPMGVRFLVNPQASVGGNVIVDSMVYIQPVSPITGVCSLERHSGDGGMTADKPDVLYVKAQNVNWQLHAQQGLLPQGARIRLSPTNTAGSWCTVTYSMPIQDPNTGISTLTLSVPYSGAGIQPMPLVTAVSPVNYTLELSPIIMPNQEPMRLSSNVGIDMNLSSQFSTQQNYFDVMFNPRGTVHGWLSSYGLVYLYLRELDDLSPAGTANDPAALKNFPVGFKAAKPQLICTLYTQTGNVITSDVGTSDLLNNTAGQWPVNGTPSTAPVGADGYADDPFFFARNGRKAGR